MLLGSVNKFNFRFNNYGAPSTTVMGTSVTPGASNAEGSWTQIATSGNIARDCYGLLLSVNNGATAGEAKNHLLDIGVDQAGGSSYTAVISNIVCGGSSSTGDAFYFPIFIKNGSSVAVRIQGSHATAGTVRILAEFYGSPSRPEMVQAGTFSETIGTITNSNGVSFTPGDSGAEGSWVSLGTTSRRLWWWQPGIQIDDPTNNTLSAGYFDLAFGDATNKQMIFENIIMVIPTTGETRTKLLCSQGYCDVPSGSELFIRGSWATAAPSGFNAVAIGIGGLA